ncbi:uncharacterized protein PSFLO_05513 [Pseudozyma flocculosa]|uniref:Uncharacterized protein n=1 Tax=Pseudozyma flocculosa TaxID=84751 RepID=A0A5C3F9G8_9BASI|nr:uncharacterized protein PSFLO_05513 [Pseudozyma flocculosa]
MAGGWLAWADGWLAAGWQLLAEPGGWRLNGWLAWVAAVGWQVALVVVLSGTPKDNMESTVGVELLFLDLERLQGQVEGRPTD